MDYILDTNICIYIIKEKPSNVFKRFKQFTSENVGISSVTYAELRYGIEKSSKPDQNEKALNKFLLPIEVVNFDRDAAFEYGIIRTELEKSGDKIGALDMLIAAHAKSLNSIVVTNNVKEFNRVKGLEIENWI